MTSEGEKIADETMRFALRRVPLRLYIRESIWPHKSELIVMGSYLNYGVNEAVSQKDCLGAFTMPALCFARQEDTVAHIQLSANETLPSGVLRTTGMNEPMKV
jgi:hypothetical protein